MADQEINSFIGKFKYLCAAGYKAALEFKSEGGCVRINLTSDVGFLHPPPQQKYRRFRGPSYQRRQQRRRKTLDKNEETSIVTATNEDEANLAMSLITNQAEKLDTEPLMNQIEQIVQPEAQAASSVSADSIETPRINETSSFEAPSASGNSHVSSASSEHIISARIQRYASQFARPEYLYPHYEPTCCTHNHIPGRGGHNVPKDGSQCCYHRCRRNPHFLTKKPNS